MEKKDKQVLQDWMDAAAFALTYIPAGHQIDLAYEILDKHYPYSPETAPFDVDRGDYMLWATSQPSEALSVMLEEAMDELSNREEPEEHSKRVMMKAWRTLSPATKQNFLKWARGETDEQG